MREEVDIATHVSAEPVEAMADGIVATIVAEMPLAEDGRLVAVLAEDLRERALRTVEDVEMQVIRSTLLETKWKKSKAAGILGISRPTLDAKIEKYKLTRDSEYLRSERTKGSRFAQVNAGPRARSTRALVTGW